MNKETGAEQIARQQEAIQRNKAEHGNAITKFRERQGQRTVNNEKVKEYSKRQLLEKVTRKFKTTMIGALASFEEYFGELWGHGKHRGDLTQEEIRYREIWEEARTAVLNKGNSCLRGALDELAQHAVNKERYKVDFMVSKDNG